MISAKNPAIGSILVVGFGFIGQRVARMANQLGYEVTATSRHEAKRAGIEAAGSRFLRFDLNAPADRLPAFDAWVWCPAFDRSAGVSVHDAVVGGLMRALESAETPPKHVVFTSTTSVYGQSSGEWVDESSPCEPRTESGRAHVEAETRLLSWAEEHHRIATVLRLSGLYGPERVIRRQAIAAGEPIACLPDTWLNLVHGDDAASACLQALNSSKSGTYCISDDRPIMRREYYETLARLLNAPAPTFAEPRPGEDIGDKRVSNRKARLELGWAPVFPEIENGLTAAIQGK
jgi:nucleoside-diphosphate-sugar epimerase